MTTREVALVASILGLVVIATTLYAYAIAGWKLTKPSERSTLGIATGHFCASLATILITFSAFFVMRLRVGPGVPLSPAWLYGTLFVLLLLSILWCIGAALVAFPALIERFHEQGDHR